MTSVMLDALPDSKVNDLMLSLVHPQWEQTHCTSLGMRGEAHIILPERCPLKQSKCDDCRWFAGHRTIGSDGTVGSILPACCGLLLLSGATP